TIYLGSLPASTPVRILGGAGNDTFTLKSAPPVALSLDGGAGSDTLDYSAYPSGVTVNLLTGAATGLSRGISNFENATGSAFSDTLVGNDAANVLRGLAGRDLLIGRMGADTLDGGADDDFLIGGWTDYDANPAALDAIRQEWSSDQKYQI